MRAQDGTFEKEEFFEMIVHLFEDDPSNIWCIERDLSVIEQVRFILFPCLPEILHADVFSSHSQHLFASNERVHPIF